MISLIDDEVIRGRVLVLVATMDVVLLVVVSVEVVLVVVRVLVVLVISAGVSFESSVSSVLSLSSSSFIPQPATTQ